MHRDQTNLEKSRLFPAGWVARLRSEWIMCLLIALLKLWATSDQAIWAIGPSRHDDLHFLLQASYLVLGQWLGPYDNFTLIKGPFFPAWIALMWRLGVPLLLSSQLLYALSCGVLAWSVRPLMHPRWFTPIFFALILLNPHTFSGNMTRVDRELLGPALTALVSGSAIGLTLARGQSRAGLWWAAGLGISFAVLWLTREEQVVVVPFLIFLLGAALWRAWKSGKGTGTQRVLKQWLAALGVWAAIVYSVTAVNYLRYGLFAKTEFDAPSFKAAYGALTRVKPPEFRNLTPVSNKTRRMIYRVSPAFRELRPYLEGSIGASWQNAGLSQQDETNRHEILGGWFTWALRDAVSAAGYYSHGRYPEEYYVRLAREVNTACAEELLDCYGPQLAFLPAWQRGYLPLWLDSFAEKFTEVVEFEAVGLDAVPSRGSPEELAFFRHLTNNRITAPGHFYAVLTDRRPGRDLEFTVRDQAGTKIDSTTSQPADSDLALNISSLDAPFGVAGSSYLISGICADVCRLEIEENQKLLTRVSLNRIQPGSDLVDGGAQPLNVLSYGRPEQLPLDHAPGELSRLGIRRLILVVYRHLNPVLAIAAFLIYGVLTLWLFRYQKSSELWTVLTGLLVFAITRIALISLLHVSSLRVPPGSYLWEAFPPMLAFVGLGCCAALGFPWQSLRAGKV